MRKRVLIALAAGLGFTAAAAAVELVSPSLSASPDNALECRIVNLSGRTQTVTITTFDSNGGVVGNNTITVADGAWGGVSLPWANGPGAGYCKFVVPRGHKSDHFRASIDVLKPGHGIIAALPAY